MPNRKLMEALGLADDDFEPNPPSQRIERTEANLDYVAMMCEIDIPTVEEGEE